MSDAVYGARKSQESSNRYFNQKLKIYTHGRQDLVPFIHHLYLTILRPSKHDQIGQVTPDVALKIRELKLFLCLLSDLRNIQDRTQCRILKFCSPSPKAHEDRISTRERETKIKNLIAERSFEEQRKRPRLTSFRNWIRSVKT